jgi:hypothetical protein
VKLLYQLDIEVLNSFIVLLGSGEFAEIAKATLESSGARVFCLSSKESLTSELSQQVLQSADALVVVEHNDRKMIISQQGEITAEFLSVLNPGLAIAHICGGVDRDSLTAVGLHCAPDRFAPPGYMSAATDYLGPKPMVLLHTAGLKVGEELVRRRRAGFDAKTAELMVLEHCSLAQGFSGYHM